VFQGSMGSLIIRRVAPGDAPALARFYVGLGHEAQRAFRPMGGAADLAACESVVRDNAPGRDIKHDLVAVNDSAIVGWCFLWSVRADTPTLGLAVADAWRGRGLGSRLADRILDVARRRGKLHVQLTVVQDNERAWRLYERWGFVRSMEFVGSDGLPYYRMEALLSEVAVNAR